MKSIKIIALLAFYAVTSALFAQNTPVKTEQIVPTASAKTSELEKKATSAAAKGVETASFKVSGNCEMCKRRIEEACVIGGVKAAAWNSDSQLLTVKYDVNRTTVDKIKATVAKTGHDVEGVKGNDKAYAKLPGCCQYR